MPDWYTLRPVDTTYFRGAEPMERGEQHASSSHFPPHTSTITGAVRTIYLHQKEISFEDYNKGKIEQHVIEEIGESGTPSPFTIIGPLFSKDEELYVPAPYTWYAYSSEIKDIDDTKKNKVQVGIIKGTPAADAEGLLFSERILLWVKKPESTIKSLGGYWLTINDLAKKDGDNCEIFSPSYFFRNEPHTGIALTASRIVKKGHLYTFNHSRLHEGVSFCFGIEPSISLDYDGIMKIGAEQRFGLYKIVKNIQISTDNTGNQYMALSSIEGTQEVNDTVIATGKIQYLGGYDLAKGFHKPMKGFYPAGSVFNKKVTNNCIAL